jgi:hypothetical protein
MTDHWDGPAVKSDPAADITDFFVFPIREDDQLRLVLVMNVNPNASEASLFSDAVDYRFRIRRVLSLDGPSPASKIHIGPDEFSITCNAGLPDPLTDSQTVTFIGQTHWAASGGETPEMISSTPLNDLGGGANPPMRVFAGLRADTSFTDLARVRMPVWRDTGFANMPGVNSIAGHNVLSLVVVVPIENVLGGLSGGSLFAACCETSRVRLTDGAPKTGRIDRMGRIEITVWIIADDRLRDAWNAEDAFAVTPEHFPDYEHALQAGLARLDNFEKSLTGENVIDWPTPHPMIPLLLDDVLVVDLSKPTVPSSTVRGYMEIERAAYLNVAHQTCGGRVPNEDVIATTLTWFINGPLRCQPDRGVGVTPDKPVRDEFPYLREPTLSPATMSVAHWLNT